MGANLLLATIVYSHSVAILQDTRAGVSRVKIIKTVFKTLQMFYNEKVSVVFMMNYKLTSVVLGVKSVQKSIQLKSRYPKKRPNSNTHHVSINGTSIEICVNTDNHSSF